MEKLPTAKQLFDKMIEENEECTSTEMMIEFAKLHVTEALKEASEKAECNNEGTYDRGGESTDYYVVDKDSILDSYPLTNIK